MNPSSSSSIARVAFKHDVVSKDHQLVAAGDGVVYVIWNDPYSTKVSMLKGHNEPVTSQSSPLFRSTTSPIASRMSNKLYLGGKKHPGETPAVLVWTAGHFFCALRSPRVESSFSHRSIRWEYTFLIQSQGGSVLYCGRSDGKIEIWNHVDSKKPRVYSHLLDGHGGHGIMALAVCKDETLFSVDKYNSNIVKVWRKKEQVDHLVLLSEKVNRMACTLEGNLYVATEGCRKHWFQPPAGVKHVLQASSPLRHSNHDPTSKARSCLVVHGVPNTVCFLRYPSGNDGTYYIEQWYKNELVSTQETGLRSEMLHAWTISGDGVVYWSCTSTREIRKWKIVAPNPNIAPFSKSERGRR